MADDKNILTQKLIDLDGLRVFWGKIKDYVDGKILDVNRIIEENERVTSEALNDLDGRLTTLAAEVTALGGAEGGIQGMIDSTIAGLDLPNTYDAKGAAATAKSEAISASAITIVSTGDNTSDVKKYEFKQGDAVIGTINLPKDLVVSKGEVKMCTLEGVDVKCLELTLTNGDIVHIPVADLVDVYTGGDYVTVGSDNVITVDKAGIIAGLAVADDVYSKNAADDKFVAKVDGERLMTNAEGTRLAGIEEGAQVNVIESVVVNGVTASIDGKTASVTVDCYTKKDVDDKDAATLNAAKAYTDDLGKIVKGVYDAGQLVTNGHAQRIEALENVAIASDDEITALFA